MAVLDERVLMSAWWVLLLPLEWHCYNHCTVVNLFFYLKIRFKMWFLMTRIPIEKWNCHPLKRGVLMMENTVNQCSNLLKRGSNWNWLGNCANCRMFYITAKSRESIEKVQTITPHIPHLDLKKVLILNQHVPVITFHQAMFAYLYLSQLLITSLSLYTRREIWSASRYR